MDPNQPNQRVGTSEEWGFDVEEIDRLIQGNTFKYSAYAKLNHSHHDNVLIYDAHTFAMEPK